jgi:hypothetical protein
MRKKFLKLYEKTMDALVKNVDPFRHDSRNVQGGFLVGDYVKFCDDYKSHDAYKGLSDWIKSEIERILERGLNLKVHMINTPTQTVQAGNPGVKNGPNNTITIVCDEGGGRHSDKIEIPMCCLELVPRDGINLMKFPDKFNYRTFHSEPEVYKEVESTTKPKGRDYKLGK